MKKKKVEFVVSTKADLLSKRANEFIEENIKNPDDLLEITPFMSYTTIRDKGAYMIGCMISYIFDEEEENDDQENN